ncbi:hypothetical protein ACIQ4I_11695 [Rummeliibacillus sp. NPDC094406]
MKIMHRKLIVTNIEQVDKTKTADRHRKGTVAIRCLFTHYLSR